MPIEPPELAPDAPSVLLVGWRVGSARALRDSGCSTTVLASHHHVAAALESRLCARVIDAGTAEDVESALAALARETLAVRDFDVVCSGSEFTLVVAAVLGALAAEPESARMPPMPVATAIALRDKMVQKSLVRAAGVRTAASRVTSDLSQLGSLPALGVVVKPLAGAGSANTHHFRTAAELAAFSPPESTGDALWLVEDYVAGSEVQIDGVVRDGHVLLVAVSRYLQNLIEVHSGGIVGAILLDPREHPVMYSRASRLVTTALAALGHRDGVFHLEAFVDGDGLVFSECAGRISGGMADESIRRMFDVDLHVEWARAILGRPHSVHPVEPRVGAIGDVYLSTGAGRIVSLPTAADFAAQPGVISCRIDRAVGDSVVHDDQSGTDDRCATALLDGSDDREVEARMLELARWFAAESSVADVR